MFTKSLAAALICSAAIGLSSGNADAAIHHSRCDGSGFTHVGGGWEEDPVCDARLAAHVGHKIGEHYTAAQLYNNPARMDEFCRGENDINLTTTCAPYQD